MLNPQTVIRAWRDEDFFLGLSDAEREAMPANPAGLIELDENDLRNVSGGTDSTAEACSVPPSACRSVWYCTERCTQAC